MDYNSHDAHQLLVFRSNILNILPSHFFAVLLKLKPTPNSTNLAVQSKYVYMTQEAIKTRKQAKQNYDDSLAIANESIQNMNETEDLNKNRNQMCKTMKQHPNMLDMLKIYCKKWKRQKESKFQKLTKNRLVYDELIPNLEPKVNDVLLK